MLKPGQKVKCKLSKEYIYVKKKLGEGGQGVVYLVQSNNSNYAVKWYHPHHSTKEQLDNITRLILSGPPKNLIHKKFIWPMDIVFSNTTKQFGYLMELIDTQKYTTIGEVFGHIKPAPTSLARCKISSNLSSAYKHLHLSGKCYRDISAGNLMFNIKNGDILICDNDNIGIDNKSKSQINGTMEYMAPEIINNLAYPSSKTDLYSLAILLFYLWMWHHPFHGMQEYQIRSWDIPAKRKIYGNPVFIFNPTNLSNKLPDDPLYNTPKRMWQLCPTILKKLFQKAFTTGLIDPKMRVTESEWEYAFFELADTIVHCPKDNAENFWCNGNSPNKCWYCGNPLPKPILLQLDTPSGSRSLVLNKSTQLLKRHLDLHADEKSRYSIIGEMTQNPNNPKLWGLKNLSSEFWNIKTNTGQLKEIPPYKSVQLNNEITLIFNKNSRGKFLY